MNALADMYELVLLALCIWREARGESAEAKTGVAWVIQNRANQPKWWGNKGIASVILCPEQFSSFNRNDPNAAKFPQVNDPVFAACLGIAADVTHGTVPDPTNGATHYYDATLDNNPPAWAKDLTPHGTIGRLHFFGA